VFEFLPTGKIRTTEDLHVDLFPYGQTLTIPAGFESDGYSIPQILWPVLGSPSSQSHCLPAVVHDWYCERATTPPERAFGDAVFFLLLHRHSEVPAWKRRILYFGVRLFALFLWKPTEAAK